MSGRTRSQDVNAALALLVHFVAGLLWLLILVGITVFSFGDAVALVWGGSAFVLWIVGFLQMAKAAHRPGQVWWITFRWWLLTFVAPIALVVGVVTRLAPPAQPVRPRIQPERSASVNVDLTHRIASFESRLRAMERDLAELKALATVSAPVAPEPAPTPPPAPAAAPQPPIPAREPTYEPERALAPTEGRELEGGFWQREIDWADLLGARALAVAGGIVTVLGIVFFFALAVNRGWIGPELRVAMGALASALVFTGGFWLRRRYGESYSSLAAVGAGIAGAYATLLFAAARYGLVPDLAALGIAAAIAGVGVWTSLAWSSELVAGIGLVGAALVPLAALIQDGPSDVGTAFVAIVVAASGVVALRRDWSWLLLSTAAAGLPQAAALIGDADPGDGSAIALAVVFGALYAAIGLAWWLRRGDEAADLLAAGLLAAGGVFPALSFQHLLDGSGRGIALFLVTLAYAAVSLWALRAQPNLAALLAVLVAASAAEAAVLVGQAQPGEASIVALAAAFAALYAALGIARHLVRGPERLDPLGASLIAGSAAFAAISSLQLLDGTDRGIALLVLAAVYLALAAVFFRDRRDLSTLLSAVGLILAAGAGGELLTGIALSAVWAAQGAVLAWLAWKTRESRFQIGSIGYLALAAGHAIGFEAPPRELFDATSDPAHDAVGVAAVAAGLLGLAFYARHDEEASVLGRVGVRQRDLRRGSWVLAGVLGTYAASLAVLDLFQRVSTFSWGEVAVTALWAAVALAALVVGLRRQSRVATASGLVGFGAPVAKVLVSDGSLGEPERWWALFAVGIAALAGGFLYQLLQPRLRTLGAIGASYHAAGLALGATAVVELVGSDRLGVSFAIVAAAYGALAASVFRRDGQRDHATLLWTVSLVVGATAAWELLDVTALVLVWTAASAALALVAKRLREPRFLLASTSFLALTLTEALVRLAPPSEFASASVHPGSGVPGLLLALGAGLVLLHAAPEAAELEDDEARSPGYRELARSLRARELATRVPGRWAVGLLGLYALSLSVLELSERVSPGSIDEGFQHGHTAVSACWGLVALGLLYAGLTRRSRSLRLAGFVLFGAALAKIFLYDLATLSSITRALSFLAVGALLLLAGFFYQRLTEQLGLRGHPQA